MKKTLIVFSFLSLFAALPVLADTREEYRLGTFYSVTYEDADENLNSIFGEEISRVELPSKGGNDPQKVNQVWGLTGLQTLKTRYGESITDEFGITDTCTYFSGCFNISKTDYYRLPILKFFRVVKVVK